MALADMKLVIARLTSNTKSLVDKNISKILGCKGVGRQEEQLPMISNDPTEAMTDHLGAVVAGAKSVAFTRESFVT